MAKIKTVCGRCKNSCPEGFTLFQNEEEINLLVKQFPFYKVVKSDVDIVGKVKKKYFVLKCDRLGDNGICSNPPTNNTPDWCQVEE